MDNTEAIKWLELLKQKNIEFDDYSEDTKEIREEATRRYQKSLSLGIQALKSQKTWHWIELGYVGNDNYDFECSECHHSDTQSKTVKVNYCWYCGAKMEGE